MNVIVQTVREVLAGHAKARCLLVIVCAVIGHRDEDIVPGMAQCQRCYHKRAGRRRPARVDSLMATLGHLAECVRSVPGGGCEGVREEYGMCPDHDGWCAPGRPAARDRIEANP